MDKRLILATAGAGKTTEIIKRLNTNDKILIITYTQSNYNVIKFKILKEYKEIPKNIKIYTYFSFLYKICFAPLKRNWNVKGLDFHKSNQRYISEKILSYYMNKNNRKMYHYRLAKFCNEKLIEEIKKRLEKYFDYIYIDEIQDFSGHDFNFLLKIIESKINYLLVGDFYQHTYDTSQDGNVNKNLYNDYDNYIKIFKSKNVVIDTTSLKKSKRCSRNVCKFIKDSLDINIESERIEDSIIKELKNKDEIDKIIKDDSIIKLFYQKNFIYNINNKDNWGNSKGETYVDVCIILNKNTYKMYLDHKLKELPSQTKNKLYVACSRPTRNLYFIDEQLLKTYLK